MTSEDKIWLAVVVVFFSMFAFAMFTIVCLRNVSVNCARVTSVGGCDRMGSCGVLLDSGSRRIMSYPTVGSISCDNEHRWIWDK